MNQILPMLLIVCTALAGCGSPESTRTRGGGPGADVGNRAKVVVMHEGSRPFAQTPQIIDAAHPTFRDCPPGRCAEPPMTFSLHTRVLDLGREHPEWKPWLTVIEEVLREATEPTCEGFVPGPPAPHERKIPLPAGATLALDMTTVARWWERLRRAAAQRGSPELSTLKRAKGPRVDAAPLFQAALCQHGKWLTETAINLGVDPDAFQAVAALMPAPFLHVCGRRWARSIAESRTEGFCPACGA